MKQDNQTISLVRYQVCILLCINLVRDHRRYERLGFFIDDQTVKSSFIPDNIRELVNLKRY
jgi:hypothetical protein